jgi:hypothetical protein
VVVPSRAIPREATRFLGSVPVNGTDYAANLVIEEERKGYDSARNDTDKDPRYRKLPKRDEENTTL